MRQQQSIERLLAERRSSNPILSSTSTEKRIGELLAERSRAQSEPCRSSTPAALRNEMVSLHHVLILPPQHTAAMGMGETGERKLASDSGNSSFAFNNPAIGLPVAASDNQMGRSASTSLGMELPADSPLEQAKPRMASATKKGGSWPGSGTPSRSGAPVPIPDRLDLNLDLGSDSLLASVNAQLDQVAARLGLLGDGDLSRQAATPSRPRVVSSPAIMAVSQERAELPSRGEPSLRSHSVMASGGKQRSGGGSVDANDGILNQETFTQQQQQPWVSRSLVELERMLHGPMGVVTAGLNTDPRTAKRKRRVA